jgi:hypothetical protein
VSCFSFLEQASGWGPVLVLVGEVAMSLLEQQVEVVAAAEYALMSTDHDPDPDRHDGHGTTYPCHSLCHPYHTLMHCENKVYHGHHLDSARKVNACHPCRQTDQISRSSYHALWRTRDFPSLFSPGGPRSCAQAQVHARA